MRPAYRSGTDSVRLGHAVSGSVNDACSRAHSANFRRGEGTNSAHKFLNIGVRLIMKLLNYHPETGGKALGLVKDDWVYNLTGAAKGSAEFASLGALLRG